MAKAKRRDPMQGGRYTGSIVTDYYQVALREKARKLELYNQLMEGMIDHKALTQALQPDHYAPPGEEGICTACRGEARAYEGRYYHPKGVCKNDDRCPVGSFDGEQDQVMDSWTMSGGVTGWRWIATDPDWSTVEIEIPEYAYFPLDVLNG